ncbi:MAG: single-stranded DNA-binding protein [Candidatus Saccharibacteria bacterium]|nr:single-stranded DNA-binding protein [Candidatus Saccharibacteria bacterium]
MRGFSKAIIAGNITRDPELRSTPSGASVCSFSVAVNRVYRDTNGEQKEDVSFIDCSAWGKLAEMIGSYAKKGTGVLVSGRLSQRSWEDKTTGAKRSRVEIVVEDFNFTGSSPRENGGSYNTPGSSSSAQSASAQDAPIVPDNIPEGEIDLTDIPF